MENFKCTVCNCEEAHKIERLYPGMPEKVEVESIITASNYMFDSRIILRACKNCGTVKASWEKISTSVFATQEEKDKVIDIQKKLEESTKKEVTDGK
jgi:pantoate kinase